MPIKHAPEQRRAERQREQELLGGAKTAPWVTTESLPWNVLQSMLRYVDMGAEGHSKN